MYTYSSRVRIRAAGVAGEGWLDQKDSMDTDLADSSRLHVHDSRLRETEIQKLVSGHIPHVHNMDRVAELRRRLDDHHNR